MTTPTIEMVLAEPPGARLDDWVLYFAIADPLLISLAQQEGLVAPSRDYKAMAWVLEQLRKQGVFLSVPTHRDGYLCEAWRNGHDGYVRIHNYECRAETLRPAVCRCAVIAAMVMKGAGDV